MADSFSGSADIRTGLVDDMAKESNFKFTFGFVQCYSCTLDSK